MRNRRIDVLKIIFCFFVLFIHSYTKSVGGRVQEIIYFISKIISDCAVPGFTIISAYFLYVKGDFKWLLNIKKKIFSLGIPYLIFITLWILMDCVKIYIFKKPSENNYQGYSVLDWLNAYLGLYKSTDWKPVMTPLWYIRDLFLCNCFAIPIKKIIDRFPKLLLIFITLIWTAGIKIPFVHSYVLIFFVFGYYLVKYDLSAQTKHITFLLLPATLVYAFAAAADYIINAVPVHRIFIIISLIYYYILAGRVCNESKNRVIGLITPVTFLIYLIHPILYAIIGTLVSCDGESLTLVFYFFKPVSAFAAGFLVYHFMKRYCPALLSIILGGRKFI